MKTFQRGGVSFQYPADWSVERDESGSGWAVTAQSLGTAFFLLSLQPDAEVPIRLAEETLVALKAEYPGVEADEVVEPVAGLPAVGHDIEFLTLDTTTSVYTRCLDTLDGPLLAMGQTGGYDHAEQWPALLAIKDSLKVEEE